jgi:hypothetical protein
MFGNGELEAPDGHRVRMWGFEEFSNDETEDSLDHVMDHESDAFSRPWRPGPMMRMREGRRGSFHAEVAGQDTHHPPTPFNDPPGPASPVLIEQGRNALRDVADGCRRNVPQGLIAHWAITKV